MESIW